MSESHLSRIEVLRHHLCIIVEECHGNLQHPYVIEASQRLDSELTRWWAIQHAKTCSWGIVVAG